MTEISPLDIVVMKMIHEGNVHIKPSMPGNEAKVLARLRKLGYIEQKTYYKGDRKPKFHWSLTKIGREVSGITNKKDRRKKSRLEKQLAYADGGHHDNRD